MRRKAFTLIEVIVATAVFAFFLGSVIAAVLADAHNGPINQRRLQAANLARESIQLVTQFRDTVWAKGGEWSNLSDKCGFEVNKILKLTPDTPRGQCDAYWRLKPVGGSVLPDEITLDKTKFTREITVSNQTLLQGAANNTKLITVKVWWNEGGQPMDITIKKLITDWKAI